MAALSQQSIEQAALWMARLLSDNVSDSDRAAFVLWRASKPENDNAWRQFESMQAKFSGLPQPQLLGKVLAPNEVNLSRRQVLSLAAVAISALGLGWSQYQQLPGEIYTTAVGEIKAITLFDGTEVVLNTATTVRVDFTRTAHSVHLEQGEIMVTSGQHLLPFCVHTSEGRVVPIGTRFSVRSFTDCSQVQVFDGEVELQPLLGRSSAQPLQAGELAEFTRRKIKLLANNIAQQGLWVQQKLLAKAMPLTEFIVELGRYRNGWIRLDPRIADLKVSGLFSVSAVDRTLYHISQILPIKLHYRTPLWITIEPK